MSKISVVAVDSFHLSEIGTVHAGTKVELNARTAEELKKRGLVADGNAKKKDPTSKSKTKAPENKAKAD